MSVSTAIYVAMFWLLPPAWAGAIAFSAVLASELTRLRHPRKDGSRNRSSTPVNRRSTFRWAPDSHVVTLTGPGGVGKTRLALAAAAEALADFDDGVFVVSLAGVDDASLLLPEVAAVLGVREGGGLSFEENLLKYLEGKRLLLVLDNLEQLEP